MPNRYLKLKKLIYREYFEFLTMLAFKCLVVNALMKNTHFFIRNHFIRNLHVEGRNI